MWSIGAESDKLRGPWATATRCGVVADIFLFASCRDFLAQAATVPSATLGNNSTKMGEGAERLRLLKVSKARITNCMTAHSPLKPTIMRQLARSSEILI